MQVVLVVDMQVVQVADTQVVQVAGTLVVQVVQVADTLVVLVVQVVRIVGKRSHQWQWFGQAIQLVQHRILARKKKQNPACQVRGHQHPLVDGVVSIEGLILQ